MHFQILFTVFFVLFFLACDDCNAELNKAEELKKQPTILIATLIRNKAHTLPYFFSLLDTLNYPKDRMSLWIRSDNNADNSLEVIKTFLDHSSKFYHAVDYDYTTENTYSSDDKLSHWSQERFKHIINLKEQALSKARDMWADYVFFLDADVFLTNPDTLMNLIEENATVLAPMLKSDGMYSNFWCGMTNEFYYMRTDEYKPLLNRENVGTHTVPMVHSAVLIDLRHKHSDKLTFSPEKVPDYDGPLDDIIAFAIAANKSDIPLKVCNKEVFGYVMVPLEHGDSIQHDLIQLTNLKLLILGEMKPLYISEKFQPFAIYPQRDKMDLSEIFMINLLRRPERRQRMRQCFKELGINVKIIDAVDGRSLNDSTLSDMGISFMPEFIDPYHKRPMTMGEIGCFLSHYNIWKEVVDAGHSDVMVLEDDVRFEPYFRQKVQMLMREMKNLGIEYDLLYLGRKRLQESDEPWVTGSRFLVKAGYSYWTLGYMLSQRGANKLLAGKPLENMVPVDEYLPILFDQHPRNSWKGYFPQRDLVALSAAPLLIYPTHYTGDTGYISDTEDSTLIPDNLIGPAPDPGARDDL